VQLMGEQQSVKYNSEVFKFPINSIKASRLELWLAIIFGKRYTGTDSGITVTVYYFRGKYYLTDIQKSN